MSKADEIRKIEESAEAAYKLALELGINPEEAREFADNFKESLLAIENAREVPAEIWNMRFSSTFSPRLSG